MRALKKVPKFASEEDERVFWQNHDSSDYVDWAGASRVGMPNLKPSVKSISLRFPQSLLDEIKLLANKRDVPYQSLLKVFLAERVQREIQSFKMTSRKAAHRA